MPTTRPISLTLHRRQIERGPDVQIALTLTWDGRRLVADPDGAIYTRASEDLSDTDLTEAVAAWFRKTGKKWRREAKAQRKAAP